MKPNVITAGTAHTRATSFAPDKLESFERTRRYREQGVVWLFPTRGTIPLAVVDSWDMLQWPPNQFRSGRIGAQGMEVAEAYNQLVSWTVDPRKAGRLFGKEAAKMILKAPFLLTMEEDNVPPPNAIQEMFAAIFTCPDCGAEVEEARGWRCPKGHRGFDAVSGLYFIKSTPPTPMAFGSPSRGGRDIDFKPRSVAAAVNAKSVIEVNGIAMGCAIWRKELFRRVPSTKSNPWFKTTQEFTQDLWFCRRAKIEAKARFGVHCGVQVAHFNPDTRQFF